MHTSLQQATKVKDVLSCPGPVSADGDLEFKWGYYWLKELLCDELMARSLTKGGTNKPSSRSYYSQDKQRVQSTLSQESSQVWMD